MSERTLQALRDRINARLQTSAISRDRASAAGREVVALCRQSDVETLEWVLSEIDESLATPEPRGEGNELWREIDSLLARLERYEFDTAGESEAYWTVVAMRDRIGPLVRRATLEAQGEGWQVTEPARDIVRREMPETRATVREAIRAARRGEGGGE